MIRKIIHIDEEKCNGCGLCANACHEGAIDIVDGKAKLMRENFCDGFGDCLPGCPMGAISFEEREAPEYDEAAVKKAKDEKAALKSAETANNAQGTKTVKTFNLNMEGKTMGCPGSMMRELSRQYKEEQNAADAQNVNVTGAAPQPVSELINWPVQIKLAPTKAPYFDNAKLLIAADCTAYSYAAFHRDFIKGRVALIGCPKLDAIDYSEKLTQIIADNNITGVTIVRMEVPCCGGLEMAAKNAIRNSGKFIPWQVVTIGIEGDILDR